MVGSHILEAQIVTLPYSIYWILAYEVRISDYDDGVANAFSFALCC